MTLLAFRRFSHLVFWKSDQSFNPAGCFLTDWSVGFEECRFSYTLAHRFAESVQCNPGLFTTVLTISIWVKIFVNGINYWKIYQTSLFILVQICMKVISSIQKTYQWPRLAMHLKNQYRIIIFYSMGAMHFVIWLFRAVYLWQLINCTLFLNSRKYSKLSNISAAKAFNTSFCIWQIHVFECCFVLKR